MSTTLYELHQPPRLQTLIKNNKKKRRKKIYLKVGYVRFDSHFAIGINHTFSFFSESTFLDSENDDSVFFVFFFL